MKGKIRLILGFLLLGLAVYFGVRFFLDVYSPKNLKTEQYGPAPAVVTQTVPLAGDTQETGAAEVYTEEPVEQVFAVDFDALQAINPDIYAWIEIPGTDISYPVVQDPNDNTHYLRTNSDGEYSAGGAIFSEVTYNSRGFDDPVTILYGHHMNAGNIMFGHLQEYYSDPEFLDLDSPIRIYTPDGVLEYGVFAAVPFNSNHILYYNNMSDPAVFTSFFETVMSIREIGAYINEDYAPSDPENDRVLILSTCLAGNNTRRFLVMGTLLSDH